MHARRHRSDQVRAPFVPHRLKGAMLPAVDERHTSRPLGNKRDRQPRRAKGEHRVELESTVEEFTGLRKILRSPPREMPNSSLRKISQARRLVGGWRSTRRCSALATAGRIAPVTASVISSLTAKTSVKSRSYRSAQTLAARFRIDKLCIDANTLTAAPHTAFQHIANA